MVKDHKDSSVNTYNNQKYEKEYRWGLKWLTWHKPTSIEKQNYKLQKQTREFNYTQHLQHASLLFSSSSSHFPLNPIHTNSSLFPHRLGFPIPNSVVDYILSFFCGGFWRWSRRRRR